MISKHLGATCHAVMRVPMCVSGRLYKHPRAPRLSKAPVKVQLGPSRAKYLDDWINVDANIITAKTDVWADLQDELPFRDNTVSKHKDPDPSAGCVVPRPSGHRQR